MKRIVLLSLILSVLLSCVSDKQFYKGAEIITLTLESRMVNKGILEESEKQIINVYLPPSYGSMPEKKYPVIYFLHGFGESNSHISREINRLNKAYSAGELQEFIFVEPNGNNRLGGSFYWNSPVTGQWEDYITKELISFIDRQFRTIPQKESRGLAGFSMGGTGTVNLGLSHPDKFNAFYAFSPGLLAEDDMELLLYSWRGNSVFRNAYGAAASPNTELEKPYAEIPGETYLSEEENNQVIANWHLIFGDLERKADAYLQNENKLSGIMIQVGKLDGFQWIPRGGQELDRILAERGIEHQFEYGSGGHRVPSSFAVERLIPFFTEHLKP